MVLAWTPDSEMKLVDVDEIDVREERLTKSLLAKSDTLELLKTILLGSTIDDSILQKFSIDAVMIHGRLGCAPTVIDGLFNLPRVPLLVVEQTRVVVALVEKLEDRGEYLGLFIW